MNRSTIIFKRFLHDRKLPSIEGYTIKDPIIKSSFASPRKWNISKTNKVKVKKGKECWKNLKKHGWFTN